jgi:uncharacterized alkaline shock family protein YloU
MTDPEQAPSELVMEQEPKLGRVLIAPTVLGQIVERSALGVPGVAAIAPRHPRYDRLRSAAGGVHVRVAEHTVSADIALIAQSSTNILDLGQRVQAEVTLALRQMVGMEVGEINVYVDDVQ